MTLSQSFSQSIHDRLKNRSAIENRPFQWLLFAYANERFLYRLAQSTYSSQFVLKGGLLFSGWNIPFRRFTRDIDFRGFTSNSLQHITAIFQQICALPVEPDGMVYIAETVTAVNIVPEDTYPGVQVKLIGKLGERTQIPIHIDIGFCDEITPAPEFMTYPSLLGMPEPRLKAYPRETVIAEKLHSIVDRGGLNSRLKDFYDIWFLSHHFDFHAPILQKAIRSTFAQRETGLSNTLPVGLTDIFAQDKKKEWARFIAGFEAQAEVTTDLHGVILELQSFLWPLIQAIHANLELDRFWSHNALRWQ